MNYKSIIEALLFATSRPINDKDIRSCLEDDTVEVSNIIEEINKEYNSQKKGIFIKKVAGGYQLQTKSNLHHYIYKLFEKKSKWTLTKKALETLSIIAYRQPINKIEIEEIRGVNSGGILKSLLEKQLVSIKGRDKGIGRALLYGTTQKFLQIFGINSLSELPTIKDIEDIENEIK